MHLGGVENAKPPSFCPAPSRALRLLGSVPAVSLASAVCFAGNTVDAIWNTDAVGNWSTPGNWSSNPTFPNNNGGNTFNAFISSAGADVTLDLNVTIESLTLEAGRLTGDRMLTLNDSFNISGGTLDGSGTIAVAGAVQYHRRCPVRRLERQPRRRLRDNLDGRRDQLDRRRRRRDQQRWIVR